MFSRIPLVVFYCIQISKQQISCLMKDAHTVKYLVFGGLRVPAVWFGVTKTSDLKALLLLRFRCSEIKALVVLSRLPDALISAQGTRISSLEAVCLLLQRLSYRT